MQEVQFKEWKCKPIIGEYTNGRTAISLVDHITHEPIATATINLPDEDLEDGQAFIKDYSENVGMSEALTEAGIISPVEEFMIGYGARVVKANLGSTDRP